jgi:hypothetical protein
MIWLFFVPFSFLQMVPSGTTQGYFHPKFSWLWENFEGLDFGVQNTNSGGENRFSIYGKKTRCFVFNFGGSKSICFKETFNQPPIKLWKKSQPL